MRIVIFDLGHTLEVDDVPLPGTHHTLRTVQSMRVDGEPVRLALLSDYRMPDGIDGVDEIVAEYVSLLEKIGILEYFTPVDQRVTLSTELGVFKPDLRLFRLAADKIRRDIPFDQIVFVTENGSHVAAAKKIGLSAIQVRKPGDSNQLPTLLEVPVLIADEFGIPLPGSSALDGPVYLARASATAAEPGGGRSEPWVRFGEDVLLIATQPGVSSRTGLLESPPDELASRARLHLVRQKGRLFQRQYPNVHVLHNAGRFLVVDMPVEEVPVTDAHGHSHFEVSPLSEDEVIFSVADIDAARADPDPTILAALDEFDSDQFRTDLEELVGFGTRHSLTDGYDQALVMARDRLRHYATRVQPFTMPGGTSANLVADIRGSAPSLRDVIVVTAHLDSVNLEDDDRTAPAPGADDNASGVAGVLAIGRSLRSLKLRHDVRLVVFGGEEQGLHGSRNYLASLSPSERHRIRAVLNMDMIGARHGIQPGVLLESSPMAQWLLNELTGAAATYTDLKVQTSTHPFASDHVPFLTAGIPAVLTIEAADEQSEDFVHSSRDTIDRVDVQLAREILRMNIAWIMDKVM